MKIKKKEAEIILLLFTNNREENKSINAFVMIIQKKCKCYVPTINMYSLKTNLSTQPIIDVFINFTLYPLPV
jgi:hypothetical protein